MADAAAKLYETRHGPMMGLAGDMYVTRSLEMYGEFSGLEWTLFESLLKPGMTVVEMGANIGAHTVPIARACAPGPLYAFEPQQRVFQLLCANLALNGVENVIALPEACGAKEGHVIVPAVDYSATFNFGGLGVAPAGTAGVAGSQVRMTPLDSLKLPACDFLKIDVEGFEVEALRGAARTITRHRPVMYVENDRHDRQQAVITLIDSLGYEQFWHAPPLYDPANFKGETENVFGGTVSLNLLCIPRGRPRPADVGDPIDPKFWLSPA